MTWGLDRFFSGLRGWVVLGLRFFVFSLGNVSERKASLVAVRQTVRSAAEKAAAAEAKKKKATKKKSLVQKKKAATGKAAGTKEKKKRGRPIESRNEDKTKFDSSPELARIDGWLEGLMGRIRSFVKVRYLALDGHFGHNQAVLMAQRHDLHLISKLRKDTALFELPEEEPQRRRAPTKYGTKVVVGQMPDKYLKETEHEGEVETRYYQGISSTKTSLRQSRSCSSN